MPNAKIITAIAAVLALGASAGCATIAGKSVYPVAVTSQPNQASVTIADETGRVVFSGTTPTTVSLEAGAGYFRGRDYTITFARDGYASRTVPVQRGVSGWYVAGNFIFGGLIGWLVVDPASGAMWTLPGEVAATLLPLAGAGAIDNKGVSFLLLADVPQHLRQKLVMVSE